MMSETDIRRIRAEGVSEEEIEARREIAYNSKTLVCDQLIECAERVVGLFRSGGEEIEQNLETLRSEVYQLEATARRAGANLNLIRDEKAGQFFKRFKIV